MSPELRELIGSWAWPALGLSCGMLLGFAYQMREFKRALNDAYNLGRKREQIALAERSLTDAAMTAAQRKYPKRLVRK